MIFITTWKSEDLDTVVSSTSIEQECIVECCTDDSSIAEIPLPPTEEVKELNVLKKATGNVAVPKATYSISNGGKRTHEVTVNSKLKALDISVTWTKSSNKLKLTTYTPSGTNLGSDYDSSNGTIDGKISTRITNPQTRTWKFEVIGLSVNGTENYTFRAVSLT